MPATQEFRGLHYDMARGNYETYPTLRRIVRLGAEWGLNQLVLYMEDLWKYRRHPALSNPHCYDPADMARLADYAAERGVGFIPSLTTLGHSVHILSKPDYRRLAFPGKPEEFDLLNPGVFDLFGDLFDEVLPHFDSPYVFLNGDEMRLHHLSEPAREYVRKHSLGRMWGEAMGRLCRMALERGKRPIIWHDLALHHADSLAGLPPETIFAYWYYDYQREYPALEWFCGQGFDCLAAPGIMTTGLCGPDWGRALPNIQGQARAAAAARPATGRCLGTMTTVWEECTWRDALLGIYATARWTEDPALPRETVLRDFAREVFGTEAPGLGEALYAASREGYRLRCLHAARTGPRTAAERPVIAERIAAAQEAAARAVETLASVESARKADLHRYLVRQNTRLTRSPRLPRRPAADPAPLLTAGMDLTGEGCRLLRTKTVFGHDLWVLTNGRLAVAVLPQFGGSLAEWVVLGEEPWAPVQSGYHRWAAAEPRVAGDPALGSPWGASGLGGWREGIFFNCRLQPSSIWGRPFRARVLSRGGEEVSVVLAGRNEVAEVVRTVTLRAGECGLHLETVATNRFRPGVLAVQPNVAHSFPGACAPTLSVVEGRGKSATARSLLDHDGSLHFAPVSNSLRVESPLTGHWLGLWWARGEVPLLLTDISADAFTLEPFGRQVWCEPGESARLGLRYTFGKESG